MRRALLLALFLPVVAVPAATGQQNTEFGRLVAQLSEAGGYFDSDNLVSNETSYLHVLPALRAMGVQGGAYLGVGPEQNFSYIAEIRPDLAVLIDIRRDNMLLHFLFKAMFEVSRNRLEFLSLLYGRPVPDDLAMWTELPLENLLAYLDRTPADSALHARNHRALMERVRRYGVAMSDSDRATVRRFHDEFAGAGLDLRFTSRGRPSRPGYPTERSLYLATDLDGGSGSYLYTEDRFRVVRDLERRDRVIPVVGDLSGPEAMKAIGKYVRRAGLRVSALYVSNVEMYLFRQGNFPKFADNVRALPSGPSSVIIRSYFGRGGWGGGPFGVGGEVVTFPQVEPGHLSAQLLQTFPAFLQLTEKPDSVSYFQLLTRGLVNLRVPAKTPPGRRRRRVRRAAA